MTPPLTETVHYKIRGWQDLWNGWKSKDQKTDKTYTRNSWKATWESKYRGLTDWEIVSYLTWKDINNSGRSLVHHKHCLFLGTDNTDRCKDKVLCSYRHTAESLRVGIVQKLRQALDDVNMKGPCMPMQDLDQGDPTKSIPVQECTRFKREERGCVDCN